MSELNEMQTKIASTLDGMVLVDAGPGTGKTHTMVERYANIFNLPEMNPRDILLMTFTNNAASEMKERLEERMSGEEKVLIQATTFDSFCLQVVLDSPESVTEFFGMKEKLTRSARLSENDTMNYQHFYEFYTHFIKNNGHLYKNAPAITSKYTTDLHNIIQKLMSRGIMPLPDYDWFGAEGDIMEGDREALLRKLRAKNGNGLQKAVLKKLTDEKLPLMGLDDPSLDGISEDLLKDAAYEDRRYLIWLVHDIYYEYIRHSIKNNRLTFGLTALFALAVLYNDSSARKRFSYRYLMVDEFQDTNELQLKITMLLLKEPNLCVVGDWKQGIYGFRNASIENILDFEDRVRTIRGILNRDVKRIGFTIPDVISYSLVENYRSSQLVIDTAFRALTIKASDSDDLDKDTVLSKMTPIREARTDIGENTKVEFITAENKDDEVKAVLCQIQKYIDDQSYRICDKNGERRPTYRDIAVLCRTSGMCSAIYKKASEYGIPAYLQGDVDIMSTREGKIALAWLRFVNNPLDPAGPAAIMADQGYSLAEMERILKNRNEKWSDRLPEDLVKQRRILEHKKRRLNDLLTTIFDYHGLNNDITQSIISVLSSVHRGSLLTIPDIIRLMEEDMKKSTSYYVDPSLDTEAVTIQTMHKSKGLEYPIVIIAGINSRSFPSSKGDKTTLRFNGTYGLRSMYEYVEDGDYHALVKSWRWLVLNSIRSMDYNEERRLFFVAISRAKQYVTMTTSSPSRFILAYGADNFRKGFTSVKNVTVNTIESTLTQPDVSGYRRYRMGLSVHDVMNMSDVSGRGDEGNGKGMEYGVKVHEAAQLMALKKDPQSDLPELIEIRRILDSLKGAKMDVETECVLPIGEMMINGIIDLIAEFPDRAEIHDYKTDVDKKYLDKYRIQLSIYYHIVSSCLKKKTDCYVDFVSLGETEKIDPMGLDEIEKLAREVFRT